MAEEVRPLGQGKQVVPTEEHAAKIRAAADARGERDLFIVARTDARQPLGLDAAIERCLAYKEAGADALFVEAPQSVEELEQIAAALPGPLVANMIERGVTPHLTRERAERPRLQPDRLPAGGAVRGDPSGDRRAHRATRRGDHRRRLRPDARRSTSSATLVELEERYADEPKYA